jgi:uncharacterized protein YjeT (DUF2065 family)
MSLIDVLIPLVIGLLLVVRPQAFTKKIGSGEEVATRYAKLRKIGYGLVGVGVLFAVIAALRR